MSFLLQDTDAAWLAGIIDGEGNIGMSKSKAPTPSGYVVVAYVQMSNTDKRIIDRVCEICRKANIKKIMVKGKESQRNEKWKDAWNIRISTLSEVEKICMELYPYLVAKKEQAELVAEFCRKRIKIDHKHSQKINGKFQVTYDGSELDIMGKVKALNGKRGWGNVR